MNLGQGQSFEAQRSFVKQVMKSEERQGRGEQEIDSLINNRIKKFYVNDDYIEVDKEHFKPRVEPLYLAGVEPTPDTLVLFGIDFMTKQQLRVYFQDQSPQFCFIDESNCLIRFPTPDLALLAIRQNLRADSSTRYKVEEEAEDVGLQMQLPREWIELQPYLYRFAKTKFCVRDYERKLYVRYATNKEMEMGFNRRSFLDALIERCKLIWENEVRKDEALQQFLEGKVRGYRETISLMGYRSERGPSDRSQRQSCRSRSRDKPKNASRQDASSIKRPPEHVDPELSLDIQSRSENTEDFKQMMKDFQQLNIEGGVSILYNASLKNNCNTSRLSGAPDVGYRVVQPAQLRMDFTRSTFDYKQYVLDSIERDEKKKKVVYLDLTDD